MIFKNAVFYRFTSPTNFTEGELEDTLARQIFTPVHTSQESSKGWVPVLPGLNKLVFEVNNCLFIRLRKDEKLLKGSAINREVEEIVKGIEKDQDRKVGKAEREEIRFSVKAAHLPTALIESKYTLGYIDLTEKLLVVDCGSFSAAEDFTSFFRATLGSLPIRPLNLAMAPVTVLTHTLNPDYRDQTALMDHFDLGEECTLRGLDGEKASFKDMDLTDWEVTNHVSESGMVVTSLRLAVPDNVAFTLTEDLTIKKIKFLDQFQEAVLDYEPEDADRDAGLSFSKANLSIMTGELRKLIDRLIDSMGGEEELFDPLEGLV